MKKINLLLVSTLIAVVLAGCSSTPGAAAIKGGTAKDYYDRGNTFFDAKDWAKAEADYTQAIKLDPAYVGAYYNRGLVYHNQKQWDKAQADFTKVIELKPDYTNAYYYRGRVYYTQESYNKAVAEFTKAIELDQNFASAYAYRASANFYWDSNRRNVDRIMADCNKAIELEPQIQAYYIRGQIYVYEGEGYGREYNDRKENFFQALSDFKQALELGGNKDVIQPKINYAQEKFVYWENAITELKNERENRYDPSKFIFISSPSSFYPAEYTKADLFAAVSTSEKLEVTEYFAGHYITPSKIFVSDVLFVSQNGTDITFRTDDNAISKRMKVDSRTGLTAGQRVRIYYRVYRVESWQVVAIERL